MITLTCGTMRSDPLHLHPWGYRVRRHLHVRTQPGKEDPLPSVLPAWKEYLHPRTACGLHHFDSSLTVGSLIHLIYTFHTHSTGDLTILFTGAVSIVFHNDRKHHCAGNTMRGIIDSTQGMCHGMCDTENLHWRSPGTGNVRHPEPCLRGIFLF